MLLEQAHHIRNLDVDNRATEFDREDWRTTFREFRWTRRHPDHIPQIDLMLEGIHGNEISGRLLPNMMPIVEPQDAHGKNVNRRALERLFTLVVVLTYGRNKTGPERAAKMNNKLVFRNTLGDVSESCYRSDFNSAFKMLTQLIDWKKSEFVTQFLYYLCRNMNAVVKPLIFDKAVLSGMSKFGPKNMCKERFTIGYVARTSWEAYSQYLILMHNWAGKIPCRPDQLVEFLRIRGDKGVG